MKITFYTTLGCHLCEQALDIIRAQDACLNISLHEQDIADSSELIERYGIRIPVVRRCDNHAELGWPFDKQQLRQFLVDKA